MTVILEQPGLNGPSHKGVITWLNLYELSTFMMQSQHFFRFIFYSISTALIIKKTPIINGIFEFFFKKVLDFSFIIY